MSKQSMASLGALAAAIGVMVACQGDTSVTVNNATPEAQITSHQEGDEVWEGETVTVRGSVSDADSRPENLIASWHLGSETVCEAAAPDAEGKTSCAFVFASGRATPTLEVRDAGNATHAASVTLTVNPNHAPTVEIQSPEAQDKLYADLAVELIGVVADEDEDATALSAAWSSDVDGALGGTEPDGAGKVTATATLTEGTHTLSLSAEDSLGKLGADTVVVTVGPANTAPSCELLTPAAGLVVEAGTNTSFTATATDPDESDDDLLIEWTSDLDGVLGSSAPSTAGEVVFVFNGLTVNTHLISMTVTDERGASCKDDVLHTVSTGPEISLESPEDGSQVQGDTPVVFKASVSDEQDVASALTVEWTSDTQGVLHSGKPGSNGISQFAISTLEPGWHIIIARVTDSDGLFNEALVSVKVNGRPLADSQLGVKVNEDESKSVTLNGTDADGDTLTYTLVGLPSNGALSGAPPLVTYTPDTNYHGTDAFTFVANDGVQDSAPGTVSFEIVPVNDPPVAQGQNLAVASGNTLEITLTAADPDPDSWTFQVIEQPALGSLSGEAPNLTYTPGQSFGTDKLRFTANDGTVTSPAATVSVLVTGLVAEADGTTTREDGGTVTLELTLHSKPASDVTVDVASSDEAEASVDPSSVVFTPQDWHQPHEVVVTGVPDQVDDDAQTFFVEFSAARSEDPVFHGFTSASVELENVDVDAAGVIFSTTTGLVTAEDGRSVDYTLALASRPLSPVTLTLAADPEGEVSLSPAEIVIAPEDWDKEQTVTVSGLNDDLVDSDVAFTISTTVSSDDPVYDSLEPSVVTGLNLDDDSAFLSIDDVTGVEGVGLEFTVTLNLPVPEPFDVDISLADATAVAGEDYDGASRKLSFAGVLEGEQQTFTVPTNVDGLIEDDELFTVLLSATSTFVSTNDTATGTIENDDAATVSVSSGDEAEEQGLAASSFLVEQSAESISDTVISFAVSGTATSGPDFAALAGTVTIPAGQTSAVIALTPVDDALVEATENVQLDLTEITAGHSEVSIDPENDSGSVDILDNDAAVVFVASATDAQEAGPVAGEFFVSQSAFSSTDTVIAYSVGGTAQSGADYAALTGQVTVAAGETTVSIDVVPELDALVELDETVTVTLTSISAGDSDIEVVEDGTELSALQILDDDSGTLSIATTADAAEAGPGNGGFEVVQSAESVTDTVVGYVVSGTAVADADYTGLSGTVTVPAGETTVGIVLAPLVDSIVEADETVTLTLTSIDAGDADLEIALAGDEQATAQIVDDDSATVSISGDIDANESGPIDGVFTVSMSSESSTETVIAYTVDGTAENGVDYATLSGVVTLPAGVVQTTVDLTNVDDDIVEADETVEITLTGISSGDADIAVDSAGGEVASRTVFDDDSATLMVEDVSVSEGGELLFFVTLDSAVQGGLTVDVDLSVAVTDPATPDVDFVDALPQVVFVGTANETKSFAVTTLNDDLEEVSEQLEVQLSSANAAVDALDTAIGVILDDDTVTSRSIDYLDTFDLETATVVSDLSWDLEWDPSATCADGFYGGYDPAFWEVVRPEPVTLTSGVNNPGTASMNLDPDEFTAKFTYAVDLRNTSTSTGFGVSHRTARYWMTAPVNGVVSMEIHYSLLHAWFLAYAQMDVCYFDDSGTCSSYQEIVGNVSVYDYRNFTGSVASMSVLEGQGFGIQAGGRNSDSNSFLFGTITVTEFTFEDDDGCAWFAPNTTPQSESSILGQVDFDSVGDCDAEAAVFSHNLAGPFLSGDVLLVRTGEGRVYKVEIVDAPLGGPVDFHYALLEPEACESP